MQYHFLFANLVATFANLLLLFANFVLLFAGIFGRLECAISSNIWAKKLVRFCTENNLRASNIQFPMKRRPQDVDSSTSKWLCSLMRPCRWTPYCSNVLRYLAGIPHYPLALVSCPTRWSLYWYLGGGHCLSVEKLTVEALLRSLFPFHQCQIGDTTNQPPP